MLFPDAVIIVFCKAPVPGQVKTRLTPPLTGEEAAALHGELTRVTLAKATQNHLCDVQLCCSPAISHPFFRELEQSYKVRLTLQKGIDLGERMHQAFIQALAEYRHAILIGCDCPSLTYDDLIQALTYLMKGHDCVLGPAEDGGYVLIGLKQPQVDLFRAMPWGSDQVCAITRRKLKALNLDHQEIRPQWDLDTPADLLRYLDNFSYG